MTIRIHPLPYASDIAFAVRDDDLSYFTPPDKLEKLYRGAWDKGFKVSLAAIPVHKGANNLNVPPEYRNNNKYYPINQNKDLVDYIKKAISEGKVDIMQHGFCHTENSNLPILKFDLEVGNLLNYSGLSIDLAKYSEFYGANETDIYRKIENGKDLLGETFGAKIKVFVAPQEFLTRPLWNAIWRNDLDYCGGIRRSLITQVPINHINLYPLLKAAKKKISGVGIESINDDIAQITDITVTSATYRHYWNKFITNESAEYWFNEFKNNFEKIKSQQSYFILLTHYWEYFYDWEEKISQTRQYEYLNKIFKYVDTYPNVWKCTISELEEWINARDNIMIKEKHGEIRIRSSCDIYGLSIPLKNAKSNIINKESIEIKYKNNQIFIILDINAGQPINLKVK